MTRSALALLLLALSAGGTPASAWDGRASMAQEPDHPRGGWSRQPAISDVRRGAVVPGFGYDRPRFHGERETHHRYVPAGHSVTRLESIGVEPGAYYGTSGAASGTSVVVIGDGWDGTGAPDGDRGMLQDAGGARIIDVASARLDRRAYGEDGIDVVRAGTAKIIRIAPGYRFGSAEAKDDIALSSPEGAVDFASLSPAEQAVTVYPDPDAPAADDLPAVPPAAPALRSWTIPTPTPAPEEARQAALLRDAAPAAPVSADAGFEPWTAEWLRDCVARYPAFDASLGTYPDETGRRRFCTGER